MQVVPEQAELIIIDQRLAELVLWAARYSKRGGFSYE
jgi:hypothetical protein